ncbi:sulfide:quinone oxidoreductase, mitochondrial isoform X1 [Aricia agestis]|uniref:sulfide:quinone oxidoreductase, mitochondrial isoform X1 n=1 Tax=Aricia agestis TaxID=91739 RepID=UPI001C2046CF|nr:sulfide:quinone oxidoreductase, mitochondrial isoform X1 [Aricia agestis]
MNAFGKIYPLKGGLIRKFSVSATLSANHTCKLLVIGGGSGGCAMAAKFSRRLPKDSVIVLEPSQDHYYQPLWTLVGGGVTTVAASRRPEASVLPAAAKWIKHAAHSIDPVKNTVTTVEGDTISYEYLIIAVGLVNDYSKVPGLTEALADPDSGVSTIYSPDHCEKTWRNISRHRGGRAVFTVPDTPIKCPGAPQKIVYLADAYFNKIGVRNKSELTYNTCLPVIFGVKKYADALMKVVKDRNINVNYRTVLREIRPDRKEAKFVNLDTEKDLTLPYDILHATPPMRTPDFLQNAGDVVNDCGFVTVDKYSLQHTKYPNIYGIGDCTDTPNSKTAAAVSKQSLVVEHNLLSTMSGGQGSRRYDGYGACPLVTSYRTCIMAEFLYDSVPHETLPMNQAKERVISYYMKKDLFPFLYWNFLLKGRYHGPEFVRKIINPFGN